MLNTRFSFTELAATPRHSMEVLPLQVHVSYLEIYNEAGYDLLDPDRDVRSLEDLPRVHIMEDDNGAAHMRNLSCHRAASEEDALNLVCTAMPMHFD